jgi:cholesterol transport system auxiliary component
MRASNFVNAHALFGGALLLALLAGCGVIPKREPTGLFEPTAPSSAPHADWPQANWSLLVVKPVASAWLDNDRIAVRPPEGEITVYKSSAWTDTAPDLVQSALLRRFEDSGKILSVARPGAGVRGDFQLQTDLRSFESVYAGAGLPEARVEIYAKLVKTSDGTVVAARSFRQTEAASSEDVGSVAAAFGAALARANDEIVGWTLVAGNSKR